MENSVSKILWVDDEANLLLRPLKRLLEENGLKVDVAINFDQAERMLRASSYSGALIDVIIPRGGYSAQSDRRLGLTLARGIRSGSYFDTNQSKGTSPDIPLSVLTVVGEEEVQQQLEGLDFLYFDKTTLLEAHSISRLSDSLRRTTQ
jgi:CheY-like chemotaxis protein